MIYPDKAEDGTWWLSSNRKTEGGLTYAEAAAVASMLNRLLLEKRLGNAVASQKAKEAGK